MKNKAAQSYIMLIMSMLIFGTIGIFRRYIPVSSSILACVRGFLGSALIVAFVKLKGEKLWHPIEKKKLLLLILSGGLMGFNWILLFEAYNYTTVAVATLCYYMQPTIVILLSPLLFKERLGVKKIVCVVAALFGMVLVSGITEGSGIQISDAKGIAFGLAAAVLYSSVVILNKKTPVDYAYQKTVIQLFSAAVILIPYILLTEELSAVSFNAVSFLMILIVGSIHTGLAYVLYFGSMNSLSSQSVAVLSYIDPVSAMLLSSLVLHESMSTAALIGAIMIIGSALAGELGQSK